MRSLDFPCLANQTNLYSFPEMRDIDIVAKVIVVFKIRAERRSGMSCGPNDGDFSLRNKDHHRLRCEVVSQRPIYS